jgi:hypothetical protein
MSDACLTRILRRWIARLLFTAFFCFGLLVIFVFNPGFLYANETTYKNFIVHHQQPVDYDLMAMLNASLSSLEQSELFNEDIRITVCLNDGSVFPTLIEKLLGPDVLRAFATNTVIQADVFDWKNDQLIFSKWDDGVFKASQWLTHSFTHCLQYDRFGFFGSNPVAQYEEWKWEGYAEYTSFGTGHDLKALLQMYLGEPDNVWVKLPDGSKTLRYHVRYLLMMRYCLDVRGLTYQEVLTLNEADGSVFDAVMAWYSADDAE